MRLIYTRDGFTKKEKEQWRIVIFQNIIDGLRMIIETMEKSNIPFEHEKTAVSTFDCHSGLREHPHAPRIKC